MEEILTLPGVARKTANVVLGTAYGIAKGVVVDTHVMRLSRRLDLSRKTEPPKIELDLMAAIPENKWIAFAHQLIWHGRRVCVARNRDVSIATSKKSAIRWIRPCPRIPTRLACQSLMCGLLKPDSRIH